jgi:hypothetical protein
VLTAVMVSTVLRMKGLIPETILVQELELV